MKSKHTISLILFVYVLMNISCAGIMMELEAPDEPTDDGILIIGNVIVENVDQGLDFGNWNFPANVVIIGRSDDGVMNHYAVTTDSKGYFAHANAPPGKYAIKAVILPVFRSLPVKLVNPLESFTSEFYRMRHPEREIEYTADWLPGQQEGRIINFGITWMGLRAAVVENISEASIGKVIVEKSTEALKNRIFWTDGYVYTREKPLDYLKQKFPDSAWWKYQAKLP